MYYSDDQVVSLIILNAYTFIVQICMYIESVLGLMFWKLKGFHLHSVWILPYPKSKTYKDNYA